MVYTFGLAKHANIRYRDSINRLSICELKSMLHALSIDCEVEITSIGGSYFLMFECRHLTAKELTWLSGHSSVVFLSETENGWLHPLDFMNCNYLDEDLPEVLKYKGKTSSSLLRMMLNTALSLSSFSFPDKLLTVLDPVCGKGTACFCALQAGMNAIGLDQDQKAVREAGEYFSRYMRIHRLKHESKAFSETSGKNSLPVREFVFADTKEHYQNGETRFLRLASGDTSLSPAICRRHPVHLILADLPYGIQHAPLSGQKPESFESLLRRALPCWRQCLSPGGVIAVSFNTFTFPTQQVHDIARSSGFMTVEEDPFCDLCHEVEQAVTRDIVFMIRKP